MTFKRGAAYAVIAAAAIAPFEGLWLTTKPDKLAYNLPTACYGMTTHDKPDLRIGDKFTKVQCQEYLVEAIPRYKVPLEKCIKVELSAHEWAALTSASYNAGPAAVCRSPMVKAFNAKDPRACDKFVGWYERAGGKYVPGLHNRRLKESALCKMKD